MAITLRNVSSQGASASTAVAVTIPSTTLGSTLIASGGFWNALNVTVGATASGATFNQVSGVYFPGTNANGFIAGGDFFIAQNVPAGITEVTVTFSSANGDSIFIWELSPVVLDTAATGVERNSTSGITINNTSAGSILIEATISNGSALVNSVFTSDGAVNGNPAGHMFPGDTTGHAPGFNTSGIYECWGASFKEYIPYTVNQYGFRFRYDDGSETTATWVAAQNVSI